MSTQKKKMTCINESSDGLITIRDFIRWGVTRFSQAELFFGHGSDNALDESFHLVFQALNLPWDMPESYLMASLTVREKMLITDLIGRRVADRKPLAYLFNQAWFCGRSYYVDERVLIPRSPIAELINHRFQPWLGDAEVTRILDLCSGSGCIGIAAAYEFEQANVDLLDISSDALEVARINIDRHKMFGRVQVLQSDLFEVLATAKDSPKYQLIISNPPYVDEGDIDDMPDEFRHEPVLGLFAGSDGLDFAHMILAKATDFLTEDGFLVLELGNSQEALKKIYPDVSFIWPEFEQGGHGVLILSAADCLAYQGLFNVYATKITGYEGKV
ncbi:MAG: 50S ribosomal protein L3 N(5)-glutamine methyltransferase [Candidatus Endonucleobacter bathymodioli]|uniref:Ribosomal protein uL3 glutamine methyltransferase n=1 Tax=Candidatus Endonucleibacter bathymodioli TaxID=539814 RepID=A0AA90SRI8_9GAMM|nr:50S ribosomal protein L3 N(5)-glutamine methyltransferase [Candidatus Endonucleobacter bathymodioli]